MPKSESSYEILKLIEIHIYKTLLEENLITLKQYQKLLQIA